MSAKNTPALPEGFEIDSGASAPSGAALPEGFEIASEGTPTKSESVMPHLVDKFKQGLAGTLALPNLAVDAAQAALDYNPVALLSKGARKLLGKEGELTVGNKASEENVGGYKQAKKGWEALLRADRLATGGDVTKNVEAPKDAFGGVSKANEYLGKIAEFAGGSVIPGAGPVVTAERKLLTAITEMLGVTSSAVSSVEAKEIGGRLGPTMGISKERGEEVGELMGSLAGPKMITLAGQGIAKSLQASNAALAKTNITGMSEQAQRDAAKFMLNEDLQKALEHAPESAANLARVIDIQKKMEGFAPNAAQATGAPGLIAMTKEVSKSSPEALAKAAAVDQRNIDAIANFKEQAFPSTKLPVNEAARAKVNVDKAQVRQDLENTNIALKSLGDQYARAVDKGELGQQLRDLYWVKKGEVKAKLDNEISDVYATAQKYAVKEDMSDVRDAVKRVMQADRETFQNAPSTYKKILAEFDAPPVEAKAPVQSRGSGIPIRKAVTVQAEAPNTEATFEKLHSLYKEANRDWMDLTAAGKVDEARKVAIVRDMLSNKVNKYNDPAYGELAQKFTDFNRNYTQYSTTFREGAGGEIGRLTRRGPSRDAEDIVDKSFLRTGDKKKGLEDFFEVYGRDEKAAKLLHDGITDNFSRAAVDPVTGEFNPKAAARWLDKNESALKELPTLRQQLSTITETGGSLLNRRLELLQIAKKQDRMVMNTVAKDMRPEFLVEEGMRDPRVFKALLSSAKTPESQKAIARSIVDMVSRKNDSFGFIKENERTLKPVMDKLGPSHWDNLTTLAEAESIANRVKAPTSVELTKIQDPAEKLIGTSGKGLLSRAMNAQKGYMSGPYVLADVAGRFAYKIRSEEMARLREAALFDPDTAKVLAKITKSDRPATKDLLDLKALAYQFGIDIGSEGIATSNRYAEERKKPLPQDTDKGRDEWRRPRNSPLY